MFKKKLRVFFRVLISSFILLNFPLLGASYSGDTHSARIASYYELPLGHVISITKSFEAYHGAPKSAYMLPTGTLINHIDSYLIENYESITAKLPESKKLSMFEAKVNVLNSLLGKLDSATLDNIRNLGIIEFERGSGDSKSVHVLKFPRIAAFNEQLNNIMKPLNSINSSGVITAVNLYKEGETYYNALFNAKSPSEGFENLATEFFRNRVPAGKAVEAFVKEDYFRAGLETVYTIFPPIGAPEALYGFVKSTALSAQAVYWNQELELFVDKLYTDAEFKQINEKNMEMAFELQTLKYKGDTYLRNDLLSGKSNFILDTDVDEVLWANLHNADPFLTMIIELQKHSSVGEKLVDKFVLQAELRWRSNKQKFIEKMIKRLETRRQADQLLDIGGLEDLKNELMSIGDKLQIKASIQHHIEEEVDGGILKSFWQYLVDADRVLWNQPLSESEKNRLAGILIKYINGYRFVLESREVVEQRVTAWFRGSTVKAPSSIQHYGMRLLTGLPSLTGDVEKDIQIARYWKNRPFGIYSNVQDELQAIKSIALQKKAVLEGDFDKDMLIKISYRDLWIEAFNKAKVPVISVKSVKDTLTIIKQHRENLLEEFKEYYSFPSTDINDTNLTIQIVTDPPLKQNSAGVFLLNEYDKVTLSVEVLKREDSGNIIYQWADKEKSLGLSKSIIIQGKDLKGSLYEVSVIVIDKNKDTQLITEEKIASIKIEGVTTRELPVTFAPYPQEISSNENLYINLIKPDESVELTYEWYEWDGRGFSKNSYSTKRGYAIAGNKVGTGGILKVKAIVRDKDGHVGQAVTEEIHVVASKSDSLIEEGIKLVKEGQLKEAIEKFEESLKHSPSQQIEDYIEKIKKELGFDEKQQNDNTSETNDNTKQLIFEELSEYEDGEQKKEENGHVTSVDTASSNIEEIISPSLNELLGTVYYGTTQVIEVERPEIPSTSKPPSVEIDCVPCTEGCECSWDLMSSYYGKTLDDVVSSSGNKEDHYPPSDIDESFAGGYEPYNPIISTAGETEDLYPTRHIEEQDEYEYIWQPAGGSGLAFDPPSGTKPRVNVTFGNLGDIEIWAEVLKDGEKVGETKRIKTKVIPPKFRLNVSPSSPYVGEECLASIDVSPDIDKKFLDFRWLPMGENAQELGVKDEGKSYAFKLKNTELTNIGTLVWAQPYAQTQIADLKHEVLAKPYMIDVNVLGPLDPKPMIWKEGKGLVEVDKEIAVHQNIRLEAKVSPEPKDVDLRYEWKLNEDSHFAGGSTGSEVMVNRSQTGTAVATVTLKDKDDNVLGTGSVTFSVTISQQQLDTAEEKSVDEMQVEEENTKKNAVSDTLKDENSDTGTSDQDPNSIEEEIEDASKSDDQTSDTTDSSSMDDSKKTALHVTAGSNWKGKVDENGFSFKRDQEDGPSRKYPAMCYSDAGEGVFKHVNGTVSAKLTGSRVPSESSDLWSKESVTAQDIKNSLSKDLKKTQHVEAIQIDNFKGYIRENALRYRSGGCSPTGGFWGASASQSAYGLLTDGRTYLKVAYRANASGFYDDGDHAWVTSHAKMVAKEAKGILQSISIGSTPKRTTTTYERMPELIVKISSSYEKPGAGDLVDLEMIVSGLANGESITKYEWTGDNLGTEGDGNVNKAIFTATERGKYTVTGTVTTSKERSESVTITFKIKKPTVIVTADTQEVIMGSPVHLSAEVKDGGKGEFDWFQWQPYTDMTFTPFEGSSGITAVKFPAPGRYKVWVELYNKSSSGMVKLSESKQVNIRVKGIDLKLNAEPTAPMVGEKVTVKAMIEPKIDPKLLRFVWEAKGEIKQGSPSADGLSYTFLPVGTTSVKVSVKALAVEGDLKELTSKELTVKAKKYNVSVSKPKRLDKAPWIWDSKQGKAVELPEAIAVFQNAEVHSTITPKPKINVSYKWTVEPKGCTVSAPFSQSTNLNAHEKKTYKIMVKATDKNGIELGKGTGSLSITVSQSDLDVAIQKEKEQKEAQALIAQGRELWKQGKLQKAIDKVENAKKLVPKDKKIINILKAMEKQKKDLDSKLKEAEGLIKQAKLKEAEKILSSAALINDKYSRYKEVLQQLADAKKKIEDEKKKIEKLLNDAKALEKAGKLDEAAKLLEDGSKQVFDNTQLTQALKVVQEQQADAVKKMTKGQDQWEKGMIDEAIKTLTEAAKIDPSNKDVSKILKSMQLQKKTIDGLLKKSSDLIMDNKFSDAETSLKKASYINDKYTQYKEVLQQLADAKKKVEDEKKTVAKLLKDAKALEEAGKLDEAAKLLEDGSKQVSDNTQLTKALKAVQEQQADAVKKMTEGQEQWEKGMLDKALSTLNEALKIDPSNKQIENFLKDIQDQKTIMDDTLITADKLIDQQKFDEAKSVLKKAEGISGNYPPYVEILEKLDVAKKIVEEITQPSTHDINYALSFAGKWNSSYGTMELKVDGVRVIGNYTHDKGRIEARLSEDGKTMKGTWAEAPSYKGSRDAGKMYFKLSSGGKRIEGLWSYGDAVPNKRWDATRITNTKIKAPVIGKGVVDNIDESTKVKPVSVVDNLKGGYWKLVDIQGYLGRECSSNEMSNNYYKHTISGGEEDIIMTKIVRKSNETYFSARVKWKRPPEKMYPKKVIGLPLSIQKLVDTNKYSSSISIGIDTHNMKCGYAGAGGRIGYLSLKSGKEQSKADTVDWVVKEPTRKKAGEKLIIRVCYSGIQVCGNKEQLGWKYHYIWVPEGTPEPQTNLKPISDKESDTAQDNLDGVTKLPSGQEYNIDRKGSDYKSISLDEANPSLCQNACIKEEKCKAWTYVKPNTIQGPKPKCWLKHSVPKAITSTCCISGIKSHLDLDSNTIRGENAIKTDSQSNGKEIVIGAAGRGSNTLKTIELSIPSGMTEHMKLVITEASELSFNGKADNTRIGEVEFYVNGKKVIPSQVEVSSNYGRGFSVEQIIDGNREYQYIHIGAKGWASTVKKNGEDWIDFHFSKPEDITKVIITTAPSRPYRLHSFSMRKYGYDKSDVIGSIPSHVQNSVSNTSKTSSKAKHCKKYSDYALRQEKDNKRLGCGYRGDRWNSRYKYHYNWCMKVPDASAKREYYARNEALKKCKSIMNLKASSKAEDYTKSRKQCRSFKIIKNAGIPGYNKEIINNISLSDCKKSCIERSWCKSVDYEREKKRCYVQNVNQSDVPLKRNYSGNPYDHYSCIHSQLSDTQKENLVNQFKGNLSGTWSGKGTGNFKGWTSNGTFIMNISESGKISGSYTGDDKGRLSGSVSSSGRLNMKSGGGSAGSGRWSGTIKINAYGKLQGSGSWSVDGFKGTWSGRSL